MSKQADNLISGAVGAVPNNILVRWVWGNIVVATSYRYRYKPVLVHVPVYVRGGAPPIRNDNQL